MGRKKKYITLSIESVEYTIATYKAMNFSLRAKVLLDYFEQYGIDKTRVNDKAEKMLGLISDNSHNEGSD